MFITKRYKLQGRSCDKALIVTIPADIVQRFRLIKGNQLDMTYQDNKLIIDLRTTDKPKVHAGAPA
jgi:hypothetical protein